MICTNPPEIKTDSFIPHTVGGLDRLSAIVTKDNQWPKDTVFTVHYMDGNVDQRTKTTLDFKTWQRGDNNIYVKPVATAEEALIRVSFVEKGSAWSHVGTNNKLVPLDQPTMMLGFHAAEHEFGHALGFKHEHQNPNGGIEWNEEVVINALAVPPTSWSLDKIKHNVLNKLDETKHIFSEFDPDSIMLYFFPGSWVKNGKGTKQNMVQSEGDYAMAARLFPVVEEPTKPEPLDPPKEPKKLNTYIKVMLGLVALATILAYSTGWMSNG